MTFLHLYTSGQVQSVHRCEVGFITIFFISLLSSKSKKKKTWWHCFDSSPRVVQAWLYKSYENEIEWSERNFKIFIPNVFTEKKKGEGKKIKEIRMTAKARKKEWNWILAECGDSRIKLNSEWSPIPKIVSRTFQPRISYAYVQHSSRYFRISPPKKRCDICSTRDITLQK